MAGISGRNLAAALFTWLVILLLPPASLEAGLSEPDNLVYGTITLDGQLITAARTDIVVEARRTLEGPAVAAYRIGDDLRLGAFYRLKVRLEASSPLTALDALLTGDLLHVVVINDDGVLAQESIEVGQRGLIARLDLVAGSVDTDRDRNGLPDAWELLHFSHAANDPHADPDQDRHSTLEEFLAGTAPNDRDSVCRLDVTPGGAQPAVSFLARRAQGVGYERLIRYQTLEQAASPIGPWSDVPGLAGIPGDNQVLNHQVQPGSARGFYRIRVWLQMP